VTFEVMNPVLNTILFTLLLFTFSNAAGQNRQLMLQKKNRNKNVYYKVGDELTFYREDKKSRIKGDILAIEDSTLVFKGYKVHINEIDALHIDEKTRWWLRFKAAQLLFICGTGYLALDVINTGEVDKNTLATSSVLLGAGAICKLFIPNKIRIKRRTKLLILVL